MLQSQFIFKKKMATNHNNVAQDNMKWEHFINGTVNLIIMCIIMLGLYCHVIILSCVLCVLFAGIKIMQPYTILEM